MNYCLDCRSKLVGRTDKKFCGDHCRSHYNNKLNKNRNPELKKINSVLKKNAGILKTFKENDMMLVTQDLLVAAGFNFHFYTHQLQGLENEIYNCCYGYAYLIKDKIVIISTINMINRLFYSHNY